MPGVWFLYAVVMFVVVCEKECMFGVVSSTDLSAKTVSWR